MNGQQFMTATRHLSQDVSAQESGLPAPPLMQILGEVSSKIELPSPEQARIAPHDLRRLVSQRESRRKYSAEPLGLDELSFLLWCTQGVREVHGRLASLRTVPSAGARHALETLLAVRRVEGLPAGLYQLDPFKWRLLSLAQAGDPAARISAACYSQPCVQNAAVLLVWVAIPYRMCWRYGERGYRYLHLDAGHVCQNLYLGAEALGLGTVAVAAFDDEALNKACSLDGKESFVIYLAPVGRR